MLFIYMLISYENNKKHFFVQRFLNDPKLQNTHQKVATSLKGSILSSGFCVLLAVFFAIFKHLEAL